MNNIVKKAFLDEVEKLTKTAGVHAELYKKVRKARELVANVRTEKDAKKALTKLKAWAKDGKKLEKKYGKDTIRKLEKKFTVNVRGKSGTRIQNTVQKAQGKGSGEATKTNKKLKASVKRNQEAMKKLRKGTEDLKKLMKSLGRKVPEGM